MAFLDGFFQREKKDGRTKSGFAKPKDKEPLETTINRNERKMMEQVEGMEDLVPKKKGKK